MESRAGDVWMCRLILPILRHTLTPIRASQMDHISICHEAIIFYAAFQVTGEFVCALVVGGDHGQCLLPDRTLIPSIQQLEDAFPRPLGLSNLIPLINCQENVSRCMRGIRINSEQSILTVMQ